MSNKPPEPQSGIQVKPRKLTRKQKAFVQHIVDNPKASGTAAALKAYNNPTYAAARQIATENMTKPLILAELAKYDDTAQSTVVEVMEYSRELGKSGRGAGAQYASVAGQLANSLLDRLHGKATQKVEQHSTTVTLSLDVGAMTTSTGATPSEK